jgi:NAD(P)-dependent dehydrogenase (short-subunit alcohol dehydrogenase family)
MVPAFSGKVALVTGAASGIGRASALAFAKAGAKVVVADISVEGGEETVELCRAENTDSFFVQCDVSKSMDVEILVRKAVEYYGRIDYAHNNAGIEGPQALTGDYPEEQFDRVVAINLRGVFLSMHYEIPHMLRQGGGAIVNTASVAGLVGTRGTIAYVASKHAVVGMTKSAALEYARSNIRVNCVCPGVIHTAMIDRFTHGDPEALAQYAEGEPVGRMGTPEEVANAVIWLCSDQASFVTGHALAVDGARVAQ